MKKNNIDISVIIVNWNGKVYLTNCIASLLKAVNRYSFEIIIVDNGSNDGSIEMIEKLRSKVINLRLIKNDNNVGFAQGNNQGYAISKGKYILFLNNDTKVDRNFIKPLITTLEADDKLAGVQPKMLMLEKPLFMDSSGSFFTTVGILYHRGHQRKASHTKLNKESYIFTMKGACMMFKKEVLEEVGLFDEDYFAYFEETDLCHRVWLSGHIIKYIPQSFIYHKGGGTTGKVGQAFIQYHSFKNRLSSYITNFSTSTLIKVLPLHIILCIVVSFGFLFTKRPAHFLAIYKALIWNVFHINKILNKRFEVQRNIRKVSDNEYLSLVSKKVPLKYYIYLLVGGLDKMDVV